MRRQIMVYECDLMICRFELDPNAEVPLHHHAEVQGGYVLSGKVTFTDRIGETCQFKAGDSYLFGAWEWHACRADEASVLLECFSPLRKDFLIAPE